MSERAIKHAAVPRATVIIQSIIAVVSLVGLAEATYLTVLALAGETAVCGGSSGCFEVLGSAYAKIGGVPVAGFGVLAYFSVFSLAIFSAFGYSRARKFLAIVVSLMFLFTLWLLGVQAFLLHAFCRYCLVSAAMVFLITGLLVATPPSAKTT